MDDNVKKPSDTNVEESINAENTLDSEDRFTTQDISDIDKILSGTDISDKDYPKADASLITGKREENSDKELDFDSQQETESKAEATVENNPTTDATPEETPKKVLGGETAQRLKNRNNNNDVKEEPKKQEPSKEKSSIMNVIKGNKKPKGLPRKKKARNWTKTLVLFITIVAVLGAIGVGGVYLLYTANFTDISNTKYTPKEKTEIYTADNVQIASLYYENRSYVSIEQVPEDLRNALVATEDSRFYTHGGVDYIGVIRALVYNIVGRNSTGQGASTITQQLARLLYLPDISTESTFMDSLNRKFKEISISYQLESKYTKDQILEMYLNEYYFGSAAYGIEAASETYFGKSVSDLNLAESALLAGLPQAPSVYAPNTNFDLAKQRQYHVLQRMVDAGYITQEQADEAYATELTIVPLSEVGTDNQIEPGYEDFVGKVIDEYASAVAPSIMRERGLSESEAESYARQTIASGGYKIYTTLNSSFQNTAINTVGSMLSGYGYDQAEGYTAALVTVDRDGAVRAYYGGNEDYSDIDMADSARQPGSNIKPLYYALALERGLYTPYSTLNDAPINIGGYSPRNSDGGYSGYITFTQSLVNSRNTTSVQIFNALGVQNAVDYIKQFGFDSITDDDYNLAVSLGGFTYGIKPYQMAAAFNTFNDGGVYNQAYFIEKVTTTAGDLVIDKGSLNLISTQLMSASTASTMWSIMQQVVTSGTGTNAACGLPTAGKTGTTDNKENLWFTGMTANVTTSIWMGNLDYAVLGGGSYIPASIYGRYLSTLINNGYVD